MKREPLTRQILNSPKGLFAAVIEIVDHANLVARVEQLKAGVATNIPRSPGDQNPCDMRTPLPTRLGPNWQRQSPGN